MCTRVFSTCFYCSDFYQRWYSSCCRKQGAEVCIRKTTHVSFALTVTYLKPDIILISSTKINNIDILLMELTISWEEGIKVDHELKQEKYSRLIEEAKYNGWTAFCFPVEIGCRGLTPKLLSSMIKSLGMSSLIWKKTSTALAVMTVRCSRWLWLRNNAPRLPQYLNSLPVPLFHHG